VNDRERDVPWGYLAVVGLAVAAAIGLLVVPGMLSPTATPRPSPTQPVIGTGPEVTTGQGTFRIGQDGNEIVIERLEPSPGELARVTAPRPGTSGVGSLACPGDGGVDPIRIVLGVEPDPSSPRYEGPPALGTVTEDGLWMVVLEPGPIEPTATMMLTTGRGNSGGFRGDPFERLLAGEGDAQPSGCRTSF
jgi:hypothetical protein